MKSSVFRERRSFCFYIIPRFHKPRALHSACFMLVSCLVYPSVLRMGATCYSETSVGFHWATWCYIPQDISLRYYCLCWRHLYCFSQTTYIVLASVYVFSRLTFDFTWNVLYIWKKEGPECLLRRNSWTLLNNILRTLRSIQAVFRTESLRELRCTSDGTCWLSVQGISCLKSNFPSRISHSYSFPLLTGISDNSLVYVYVDVSSPDCRAES
jgi:hypothetical protein